MKNSLLQYFNIKLKQFKNQLYSICKALDIPIFANINSYREFLSPLAIVFVYTPTNYWKDFICNCHYFSLFFSSFM